MRSILDNIKTSNLASKTYDFNMILLLQTYFSNIFAEALVSINPIRSFFYTARSALSSDMDKLEDKIKIFLENLIVVKEYLETFQSYVR